MQQRKSEHAICEECEDGRFRGGIADSHYHGMTLGLNSPCLPHRDGSSGPPNHTWT